MRAYAGLQRNHKNMFHKNSLFKVSKQIMLSLIMIKDYPEQMSDKKRQTVGFLQ